ncbi:hypothetical protein AGMMS50233_10750 [Endomicrobiia bacterium]|nr:hypothetical protein AGMMS50233_10750 [Endomicrobiia bacterium]
MQEAKFRILDTNNLWTTNEGKAHIPSGLGIISMNGNFFDKKTHPTTGEVRYGIQHGYIYVNNILTQKKEFNYTTKMLLNFALMQLKNQNASKYTRADELNRSTKINVSAYKDLRKNISYRPMHNQILNDCEILYNMRVDWLDKRFDNKKKPYDIEYSMRILSSKAKTSRGEISITFTPEMAEYVIKDSPTMSIPWFYWECKPRIAELMFKVATMIRIKQNKKNQTRDKIYIKIDDLCKYAINMPSTENNDNHIWRLKIDPLQNACNELRERGSIDWHYCNDKKVCLGQKELYWLKKDYKKSGKWQVYKNMYILFVPPKNEVNKQLPQACDNN